MICLFSSPLAVGSPAPHFELPDQDGNLITLASLRGRNVVLVFYPADDTSVCTKQLCEFRDRWPMVQQQNAIVFGVNPGKNHAAFRDKFQLPFPLLLDQGQKVGAKYRAKGLIVPKRTVYLIAPDGVIRYAQRGKPEPEEVLAAAK
jgi:thioredoxin-dependent peroxiredoxin